MPKIKIPEIKIPTVDIPDTPFFTQYSLTGNVPGCNPYHRDLETSRNPSLLWADPNGVSSSCPEGQIPSFNPMRYNDHQIPYVKPTATETKEPTPQIKIPPPPKQKKKEEKFFIECPGPNDQRIGDFRNDKKLERISGHKLSEDGKTCITLYEPTNFRDQYIPSMPAVTNAAAIALVAASTPILLNIVKPIVKNLVKKLTGKKKKENDDEVKPD